MSPSLVVALIAAISVGWQLTLKRAGDRVFALLAVLFLAPLLLAIAVGCA